MQLGVTGPSQLVEPFLQVIDHGLQDLEAGVPLVVRLDEYPGGFLRARVLDDVLSVLLVSFPQLTVAPVLLGQLPVLVQ